MPGLITILIAAGIFILLVVIQMIVRSKRPIRSALGGILTGLLTLVVVNITGVFTGVSLPLSLLNIGVSAAAGIPGVTMLLLLNLIVK